MRIVIASIGSLSAASTSVRPPGNSSHQRPPAGELVDLGALVDRRRAGRKAVRGREDVARPRLHLASPWRKPISLRCRAAAFSRAIRCMSSGWSEIVGEQLGGLSRQSFVDLLVDHRADEVPDRLPGRSAPSRARWRR